MDQQRVCKASKYSLPFKAVSYCYELINYFLLKYRFSIVYYYYADLKIVSFINELRIRRDLLLTFTESVQLYELAKSTVKLKGDFAEVGTYKGGSSKIIASVKGDKKLHLFDTFEGLPKTSGKDKYFDKGEYYASLEDVKNFLKEYKRVYFYKGIFPNTAQKLINPKFSFVHLDVDLYKSTKESLEYFYPKMVKGGVIISHDYPSSVGVKRAFDEFMKNIPEIVVKLSGNQGLLVKN